MQILNFSLYFFCVPILWKLWCMNTQNLCFRIRHVFMLCVSSSQYVHFVYTVEDRHVLIVWLKDHYLCVNP